MFEKCPVCRGRGLVPAGFYDFNANSTCLNLSGIPETCRSCSGKGYISTVSQPQVSCTIRTCRNCGRNDGIAYMSNPPLYKCTKDGRLYHGSHTCDDYKDPEDSCIPINECNFV